jgi:hypothetical protein
VRDAPKITDIDPAALRDEGLTTDEIAQLIGKSKSAVWKALDRAAATALNGQPSLMESQAIARV